MNMYKNKSNLVVKMHVNKWKMKTGAIKKINSINNSSESYFKINKSWWSYYKGLICEFLTIIIYSIKLYRFRGWRVRNKFGEIDLIFSYGDLFVFIEVKYRKSGIDESSLSYFQFNRIKNSAKFYLAERFEWDNVQMRFDFIVFSPFPRVYYNIV